MCNIYIFLNSIQIFKNNVLIIIYPGLKGSSGVLKLTIKVAVSGFRSNGDWGPIEFNDKLLSILKPENKYSIKN